MGLPLDQLEGSLSSEIFSRLLILFSLFVVFPRESPRKSALLTDGVSLWGSRSSSLVRLIIRQAGKLLICFPADGLRTSRRVPLFSYSHRFSFIRPCSVVFCRLLGAASPPLFRSEGFARGGSPVADP